MKRSKSKETFKSKKDYTMVAIMIFVVSFFLIFAIRPSIALIITLMKEKEEYQRIDLALEAKIQQIIQAQTNYMEALNKKKIIEQAIPNNHDLEQVSKTFNDRYPLTSFYVKELNLWPQLKNKVIPLRISFGLTGNFSQFKSLLSAIYKNPRLYKIVNLSAGQDNSLGTESANLKTNYELETYYLVN